MLNDLMVEMLLKAGFRLNDKNEWWSNIKISNNQIEARQAIVEEDNWNQVPTILVGLEIGGEIDWSDALEFSSFIMLFK